MGGESMLFIFKKKKVKKENVSNKKTQLTNPFCAKLERRRRATEDSGSGRGPSF